MAVVIGLLAWFGTQDRRARSPGPPVTERSEPSPALAANAPRRRPAPGEVDDSPAIKQCLDDIKGVVRLRTAELGNRSDARSQLAYALVARHGTIHELSENASQAQADHAMAEQRARSQRAFARARVLAPDDPDILWLSANQCGVWEGCDAVEQDLIRAEPDNAAVWLMAMGWARSRGDDSGERAAFERAIRSSRYDRHGGSAFLAVLEGFKGIALPAACQGVEAQERLQDLLQSDKAISGTDVALMQASTQELMTLPTYAGLARACRATEGAPLSAATAEGCIALLGRVADGDTLLEQTLSLRLLVELTAASPDGAHWRERYRNQQWMMEQLSAMYATGRAGNLVPERLATSEVQAILHELQRQGLWPAPPGWLPRNEQARRLLGGAGAPSEKPR